MAQAGQEASQTELPTDQTTAVNTTQQAASESAFQSSLSDTPVTYEQILADPDNIDLNLRYAKQQIARNDIVGAATTLERILLINPELLQVRLLYAVVLFRLDNYEEAERELLALRDRQMPPSLRRELDSYVQEIRRRRRHTRFALTSTIGWQWDRNRNAASSSARWRANPPTPRDQPEASHGPSTNRTA